MGTTEHLAEQYPYASKEIWFIDIAKKWKITRKLSEKLGNFFGWMVCNCFTSDFKLQDQN